MPRRTTVDWLIPVFFWVLAIAAVPFWCDLDPGNGWDAKVYRDAIRSLQAGHDPYADGIAAQSAFYSQIDIPAHTPPPYAYVYAPLTLPLLRMAGALPESVYTWGYWLLYGAAALAQLWVTMQAAEPKERRFLVYVAPAAAFFPGLLQDDTLKCGNVAYILYGLVFLAALHGWRRDRWRWFYAAALAASAIKAPLLSLLAIPILSARRQWIPAGAAAAAGVGMFAMQMWLWPTYFRNYLRVVELQFAYNHDFGISPAGLFSAALSGLGLPYSRAAGLFYILYALLLAGILFYLARQYFDGKFSLERWMPVMLAGVILLDPRVMEYDVAPITLLLALILWRAASSFTGNARAVVICCLILAVLNAIVLLARDAGVQSSAWKNTEGCLLVMLFAAGSANLLLDKRWLRRDGRFGFENTLGRDSSVSAVLLSASGSAAESSSV